MSIKTDLLIVGAGPFGLSMSAYAKHLNIDYIIVGRPMEFWKNNMPAGMRLRSGPDRHLDPLSEHTLIKFLQLKNINSHNASPLPIKLYLGYTEWFRKGKKIDPINEYIARLDYQSDCEYRFIAHLESGDVIEARFVILAIGFGYFKNIPENLIANLPDEKYSHTADFTEFSGLKSKNCIIVGGRQSAFESALLIKEAGAKKIYIVHRHKTPKFTQSDWSWVTPLLGRMIEQPDYYLKLSEQDKDDINKRFWQEGRLKLESWLKSVEKNKDIDIYEETNITWVDITREGQIKAALGDGAELTADHLIFATGYKVNIANLPFLNTGNILDRLQTNNGFPKLRFNFESSIEGLYFTSLTATSDFGAFFGFTVSCNASSVIIGNAIAQAISKS